MTGRTKTATATSEFLPVIATAMIAVHALLRGWQAFGGWFFGHDFKLISTALDNRFDADLLLTSHDGHLMPFGVAVSWIVAHSGTFAWGTAAAITVALQTLAAVTCFLALRTLFGARPAILVPLGFYLFSAMAPEGFQWWSTSLSTVPLHIAFFGLVIGVARWSRGKSVTSALIVFGSVGLAVLSSPRGLLMTIPVVLLAVIFLTDAPIRSRPMAVLRRDWLLIIVAMAVGIAYVVILAATAKTSLATPRYGAAWQELSDLLVNAWVPSLLGGPWNWAETTSPLSTASPPLVLIVLSGVVALALAAWSVNRSRAATLAALAILLTQLVVTYLALALGGGLFWSLPGSFNGPSFSDLVPVTTLCIGLSTIQIQQVSGVQPPPAWVLGRTKRSVVGGIAVISLVGALTSTVLYSANWHANFPTRSFVQTAGATLNADPGPVADLDAPSNVQIGPNAPNNLTSALLRPYGDRVDVVDRGNDLRVLDQSGVPQAAAVAATTSSLPGPPDGCGYRIDDLADATIAVTRDDVESQWWLGVGYLASADGQVELQVYGQRPVIIDVQQGLHTYLLKGERPFGSVRLASATPGLTLCVDKVTVGNLEAL